MPKTKQEYKDDLLRAFGKTPYSELNEYEKKEYDDLIAPFKGTNIKYEEMYQYSINDKVQELESKRSALSNQDSIDDIDMEIRELEINEFDRYKKYRNVNEKYQIEDHAIKNGLKMYANAKQAYDSLKWYQKIAAHFRSGDTYEPSRRLRELNAYKEVINDCGLKKDEVEKYTNTLIKENTFVDVDGKTTYNQCKYIDDYRNINDKIEILEDDEMIYQTEDFLDGIEHDSDLEMNKNNNTFDLDINNDSKVNTLGDEYQV